MGVLSMAPMSLSNWEVEADGFESRTWTNAHAAEIKKGSTGLDITGVGDQLDEKRVTSQKSLTSCRTEMGGTGIPLD